MAGLIDFNGNARRAVYDINSPLILEASAGSGKTTVLVARFVSSLLFQIAFENQSPRRAASSMVAVTFTRLAASELLERIRAEVELFDENYLLAVFRALSEFNERPSDFDEKAAAAKILSQKTEIAFALSSSEIGTISAYGKSILSNRPVESGVDPGFSIEEETSISTRNFQDAIFGLLRQWMKVQNPDFAFLVEYLGLKNLERWFHELFSLSERFENLSRFEESLNQNCYLKFSNSPTNEILKENQTSAEHRVAELIRLLQNLAEANKKLKKEYQSLFDELSVFDFDIALHQGIKPPPLAEAKTKPEVTELRRQIVERVLSLNQFFHQILFPSLWRLFLELYARYEQIKAQKSELTFSDIERRLLFMLKNRIDFKESMEKKIRFLMIDEYQDTSDIQKEIFDFLMFGSSVKAFVVGDPKQSVYRFRGANVSVFSQTAEDFKSRFGESSHAVLEYNYRSTIAFVEGVNRIFEKVFEKSNIAYFPQKSHSKDFSPAVSFHSFPAKSAEDALTLQAEKISGQIHAMLLERDENKNPKYALNDFLILKQNKTGAEHLHSIFSEHFGSRFVPIVEDSLFDSDEVSALLSYLSALNHPESNFDLLPVLKSPFFRYSDAKLLFLKREMEEQNLNSFFFYLKQNPDQDFSLFLDFLKKKNRLNVAELMDEIVEKTGYLTALGQLENGVKAQSNLRLFLERIRNELSGRFTLLTDFLYENGLYGRKITAPKIQDPEEGLLRLLTIHKSKGLEAKVVFLIASTHSTHSESSLYLPQEGSSIKLLQPDSAFQRLFSVEKEELIEERRRLFYVAVTRAKEHFYYFAPEVKGWSSSFSKVFDITNFSDPKFFVSEEKLTMGSPSIEIQGKKLDLKQRFEELLETDVEESASDFPSTLSVSQVLDIYFNPASYANRYLWRSFPLSEELKKLGTEISPDELFLPQSSRADLGTMLHEIFELCDENSYLEYIAQKSRDPLWEKDRELLAKLSSSYFESEIFRRQKGSQMKRAEWEFSYFCEQPREVFLRGTVDQYFVSGGCGVILDYKLRVPENHDRYALQLNLYALVLSEAGHPVDELLLYDIENSKCVSVSLDPEKTKAALEESVARVWELFQV